MGRRTFPILLALYIFIIGAWGYSAVQKFFAADAAGIPSPPEVQISIPIIAFLAVIGIVGLASYLAAR